MRQFIKLLISRRLLYEKYLVKHLYIKINLLNKFLQLIIWKWIKHCPHIISHLIFIRWTVRVYNILILVHVSWINWRKLRLLYLIRIRITILRYLIRVIHGMEHLLLLVRYLVIRLLHVLSHIIRMCITWLSLLLFILLLYWPLSPSSLLTRSLILILFLYF